MAKYTRLSYHERVRIRHLLKEGYSIGQIAKDLSRSKSTIHYEIHRKGMTAESYYYVHGQSDKKFRDRLRGRKKRFLAYLSN